VKNNFRKAGCAFLAINGASPIKNTFLLAVGLLGTAAGIAGGNVLVILWLLAW